MIAKNRSGFSLIEVLVATGIMMMVALATIGLISNQNKEVKALTEKLIISDLKTSLAQVLSSPTFCSCLFRNRTFNTVTDQWAPLMTFIPDAFTAAPAFPALCTASAQNLVPPVGSALPGSSVLSVSQLQLIDTVEVAAGTGTYKTKVSVGVTGGTRVLRNIEANIVFNVNLLAGAPASRPFLSCSGGGAGGATLSNCAWTAFSCNPMCPANKVAAGIRANPPFNEDCGGGGNDYDEPSRSLNCCDLSL